MATKKPATLDFSAARNGTPEPAAPPVAAPEPAAPPVVTGVPIPVPVAAPEPTSRIGKIKKVVNELLVTGQETTIKTVAEKLTEYYPGTVWKGDKYTENKTRDAITAATGGTPVTGKKRGRKPGSKNKPVAASTTAKPPHDGDRMACLRWATVEAGGVKAKWGDVATLLERTWPVAKWRTDLMREHFGLYQKHVLKYPPSPDTTPKPVAKNDDGYRPPLAMNDIAGFVEMTQHMANQFGWDQVTRLVVRLKMGAFAGV